ncbi:MAG: GspH/FimT family pseudopilin [bacterium]|nr:GspH/FimT family pseudopilin [bacterium]
MRRSKSAPSGLHHPSRLRHLLAFSLVEVTLVISIIGVLSAIAIPRFTGSIANARLNAAAQRIERDCALARSRAMSSSKPRTIVFSTQGYTIAGLTSLDRRSTNYSVSLSGTDGTTLGAVNLGGDQQLIFDMYGAPDSGGTIVLISGGRTSTLTIDPLTGKVTR